MRSASGCRSFTSCAGAWGAAAISRIASSFISIRSRNRGKARLAALAETNDGFEISERDLQLRGPGDFFGTRQSGLPTLRTGDLLRDHSLMERAREEAVQYLDGSAMTPQILESLRQTWPTRFGLMDIG